MGTTSVNSSAQSTPLYTQVLSSKPVEAAKAHPAGAAAAMIATGMVAGEAALRSDVIAMGLKKGAVPLLAGGAAVLGASMVKDALQNDQPLLNSSTKALVGTSLIGAGVEVTSRSALGVSPLEKAVSVLNPFINKDVLASAPMAIAGTYVAVKSASNIQKEGLTVVNAAGLGLGATAATYFSGSMLGFALPSKTSSIFRTSDLATLYVGTAALGLSSYTLGKNTLDSIRQGNPIEASISAVGATATAGAAVHFLGQATPFPALNQLAQKAFTKHPFVASAVAAATLTGAGYLAYQQAQENSRPESP